ncbi:MAG TPA: hypothetical protein VH087_12910 [Thermoanaerobaculia bacterium]|nr:hypothetical protein [Thermoanaerobaculia bacterium]
MSHVLCLFSEAFEVIEQLRNAPESPMTSYLPAVVRRAFRRNAKRLRRGTLQPLYGNLYSAEQLAMLLERAAERDETIERCFVKLTRIEQEIRRVFEYQRAELAEGTRIVYELAGQRALEDGPESKAADFFRLFREMIAKGAGIGTLQRRKKGDIPLVPFHPPGADPHRLECEKIIAAEVLAEAPATGESVLRFGPEANGSAEPPVILRIGIGERSWVGSFARGATRYSTVQLMPDGAHLLVVVDGAGYVVEAVTRSLAGEEGNDIMNVQRDEEGLLTLDRAGTHPIDVAAGDG